MPAKLVYLGYDPALNHDQAAIVALEMSELVKLFKHLMMDKANIHS